MTNAILPRGMPGAAVNPLTNAIRRLRRALIISDAQSLGDGELLDCFLTGQNESAFEALLHRHGPMVRGVCRRVLGNAPDADDAFQATFLVLLHKGNSIRPRDKVGPWLCGVAYRCASKARTLAARRLARERPLADYPAEPGSEFDRHEWLALLDKELNRLPEKYRAVLILCDLQGESRRVAATRLQLSEGTLSSRLARARAMIGDRLKRRGVALSAALLAFSQSASAAVPPALTAATAVAVAAAQAGDAVAPAVAFLNQGVLQAMVLTKVLKSASLILLVAGLSVGLGARSFLNEARADKPAAAEKPAKPADGVKPVKPGAEGQKPVKPVKPAAGAGFQSTVKSADDKAKTITVNVKVVGATKEVKEETYPLGKDAQIVLEHGLKKETKQGQFSDLIPGTPITVELAGDMKSIVKISVRGLSLMGNIKSVDATKNTITVAYKDPKEGKQVVEKTIELEKEGKIFIDDGAGTMKEPTKEGKFTDLTEGTVVNIQMSAIDRTKAISVRASGPSVNGTVKGVDVGNNTITITTKGDGEKTYTIAKDVRIKGNLADIVAGSQAQLRLSLEDKKTVVAIVTFMK